MELKLDTSVQYIPRVGPVMAKKLERLGVRTVEDFLWYAPFRYDDFSAVSPISGVRIGDAVTIAGVVQSIANVRTKTGKRMQIAVIADASGSISAVWFNQPFLLNTIKKGEFISLAGKAGWFGAKRVLESPVYELGPNPATSLNMGRLVPIYSETEGLSSKWLRGRINFLLENCAQQVSEYIPASIRDKYGLMEIKKAIEYIHFPINAKAADEARRRLAFDELFLTQLFALEQKRLWQTTQKARALTISQNDVAGVVKQLPFTLTDDQTRAIGEILSDTAKSVPMNRLLEGDVGSGKTVVAAIAMYVAYKNEFRSFLMAPTQILAEQHFATIQKLLSPMNIPVGLVTGNQKIENAPILVGTHALLNVPLKDVALVIVDEQHRFGVKQRANLTMKYDGKTPHLLTMTATPIPRTTARVMYGNLDLSVLNQMPAGRQTIKTWVVPKVKRERAYQWIAKTIRETNGQAFIICPFIEESETMQSVKAVKTEFTRLQKTFTTLKLGLLHGKLKATEKTQVLEQFNKQKLDILVATPVVEVGIDVPNAIIIMIEGSERFGLAQLHQLRGRVGRGQLQSYCLLFTESSEPNITNRLKSLETMHSGPLLAEVDLKLRGPGELFGTRQHGIPMFKIARLDDTELTYQAQEAARAITTASSDLSQFPQLREKLKKGIIGVQD